MSDEIILVPVDGASNIKLEALDFESLAPLHSCVTESPNAEIDGLLVNCTGEEFDWFDEAIRALPAACRNVAAVAPVARGCSGGLVGPDNALSELPGKRMTLAYTHRYPDDVEERFHELAGSASDFFLETGSVRDFPGSLTLLKRFVFEEMKRPEMVARSTAFVYYGALMAGHFCGDDYLGAHRKAGNEHSYWMCHSGARDVNREPGTTGRAALAIESFGRLVPRDPAVSYKSIGTVPDAQASSLGISGRRLVVPGGHDTCLSHIPVLSTFYQVFPDRAGEPVIHVEAGTWTMIAQIGGMLSLPADGYARDILVQGTVDGEAVLTARYGGGGDFAHLKRAAETSGAGFDGGWHERAVREVLRECDCFVLPNVNPANLGTGPFPESRGRIVNERAFLSDPRRAHIVANLATALPTAHQVRAVAPGADVPIVLTGGGARDPCFGRLLASLTGRIVYTLFDRDGNALAETTTLGAAVVGKAACLGVHPYEVDMAGLGAMYREISPLPDDLKPALTRYRHKWMDLLR